MQAELTEKIGDLAAAAGIRRVHVLAWRDLDDRESGGSEVHCHEVLKRFAAAGIEVSMRTSYAFGEPVKVQRDGYRVIRKAGRYLVFPRAIISEVLGWHGRADALIEYWNGVPFMSPVWFRGPRITVLHHLHRDMWPIIFSERPRLARLGDLFERKLAPPFYRATRIVTLSESSRRELLDAQGFRPEQVSVTHPGIAARFSPGGQRSAHPLVVTVSRLMPTKRIDALIRIAAQVKQHVPDLELAIAGDGPERHNLESLIAELGAEDWITLRGRLDDDEIVELYRSAWAVASASLVEGWGMTLTEAAACGTTCVASRILGHEDAVRDGRSGLLAEDDDALAEKLVQVLTDSHLRDELQHGALEWANELSWDRTALEMMRTLALAAAAR